MTARTRFTKFLSLAAAGALALSLTACSGDDTTGTDDTNTSAGGDSGELITVGFVAVGPEGAWRQANEGNIQDSFSKDAGFDLKYAPAVSLDQKSQIDAFTSFVDEDVDVILLSATEGSGWEDSLKRAQEAEIPVILIDRGIEPDNTDLYVTRIAPDNIAVSTSVAEWAKSALPDGGNYFVLEGPAGVSVVNERNKGWDAVIGGESQFNKIGAQTANWSTEEAKSVFETVLKSNNNDVQLVFAQNDEMGLGAAQAVEEAGLKPGEDVKIATIDGTTGALQALADGRLSFVAEYNPMFGDVAVNAVKKVLNGEQVDSYIIAESATFDSPEVAAEVLPDREF